MAFRDLAYFREQSGHRRRKSGDAENGRRGCRAKCDGREFTEAAEKLPSLGIVESDKFGGLYLPRHRGEVALVPLENRLMPGRLNHYEPGVSTQETRSAPGKQP